ncbi:MAG: phosphoglucosamine mutase [Pseudomonadota bacterium]
MTRKYFGTDGIRGKANTFPMTADMALKVAIATAHVLREAQPGDNMNRVVIGKDTRLSCYMLEQAMTAGFLSMGMDVILTGPIPTPAVARLTYSLRADLGVMISASHNAYQDNGIKLFGFDGYKLSDDIEKKIEDVMDCDIEGLLVSPEKLGKAARLDDAPGRYVEFVKRSLGRGQTLEGLKVVVDCANGAAYKVAPQALWELEAKVVTIGNQPNGRNINQDCGATDTKELQERVVAEGADLGIAMDGDADRLIVVDEKGQRIDGDQLMGLIATRWKEDGQLAKDTLVATVMSNLGLERYLKGQGITMLRTPVGDRYVVETMRDQEFSLGGEQSGHIVMSEFGTTGDGLMAALQVMNIIRASGKPASEVCNVFEPLPQVLQNVTYDNGTPLDKDSVKDAIAKAEETLANDGRLLVRPSGTEPVIRVMAEGDNPNLVKQVVGDLCTIISKNA